MKKAWSQVTGGDAEDTFHRAPHCLIHSNDNVRIQFRNSRVCACKVMHGRETATVASRACRLCGYKQRCGSDHKEKDKI